MRWFGIVMVLALIAGCTGGDSAVIHLPDFDTFWNYDDPAATETRFRELLPQAQSSGKPEYVAELMTQIARAQGLQQKYGDAFATLDQADALIKPEMKTARVRSLLERGRVLNSSGKPVDAVPLLKDALLFSRDSNLEYYAVDAAHMLGIATKGDQSLRWNEQAIQLAEAAKENRARKWLGPLYNNTGWTFSDLGRYGDALKMFEKDIQFRKQEGTNAEVGIARWSMATMLRHLGRVDEALRIQMELLAQPERKGNEDEGYTHEEIGECLLLLGRHAEAKPHFTRAWELLHNDPWLARDEPKRLERLKKFGGIP